MKGSEITTADIADKIADLIIGQTYISKADLAPKINAYLKGFVKIQSIPKLYPADLKQTEILRQKTQSAMYNELAAYYASELCKIVGKEAMGKHNRNGDLIKGAFQGNPINLITVENEK